MNAGSLYIESDLLIPRMTDRGQECGEGEDGWTDQSSEAIPRSLQHRIRAFDLHASVAVGIPLLSKNSCSPRAIATRLVNYQRAIEAPDSEEITGRE